MSVRGHIRVHRSSQGGAIAANLWRLLLVASGDAHTRHLSQQPLLRHQLVCFAPEGPLSVSFQKCFVSVAFLSAGVRSPPKIHLFEAIIGFIDCEGIFFGGMRKFPKKV